MTTTARAAVVTWGAAVTALVALLAPGDWRVAAGVPLLGTWAVWRWTAPGGRHAGPGRTSPRPGPTEPPVSVLGPFYGSMALDAELDWQARNELPPRAEIPGCRPGTYRVQAEGMLLEYNWMGTYEVLRSAPGDPVRKCSCEPDPDDVWPESEHPSPPFLPAAPPSAAESVTAPAAQPPAAGADGWDEASLAELRDAPSVLDGMHGITITGEHRLVMTGCTFEQGERLADTGEIALAPLRAEWAVQLEDQDADARSFLRQLEQSALHYRLGLAGSA